ncbi:unnamed protein product [Blepharisma stoltei]|uniref:Uncharacterized protein n=1 Tax=Blepharisma stoltei TaxID=1481888 RepID=A0AAU9JXB1_9CILI|nr:unnamed protein product [Blepharisma stoltei]
MEEDIELEYKDQPRGSGQNSDIARYENLITLAEYRYNRDASKLEQALLRTRKLGNIHLVGLHLRMIPLIEAAQTLPLEYAFYNWKSECRGPSINKLEKHKKLFRHLSRKILTRAFILFREKSYLPQNETMDGPGYAHGALPPIYAPEEDEFSDY